MSKRTRTFHQTTRSRQAKARVTTALALGLVLVRCQCFPDRTASSARAAPPSPAAARHDDVQTTSTLQGASNHEQAAVPSAEASAPLSSRLPLEQRTWSFTDEKLGASSAVVLVPQHAPGAKLGVLVALHGRGEALKGPASGARAFVDDYGLLTAWKWLAGTPQSTQPPLTERYRLELQRNLREQPFSGMVVLMPFVPDIFQKDRMFSSNHDYAPVLRHFAERALRELPVDDDRARWALDGISLGGRVALATGPLLADRFGTVAAIQAAIDEKELSTLRRLMHEAQLAHPELHYSLVTSEQDYFREVLFEFHQALDSGGVKHEFTLLPGDHSYAFNRGPGATHLLLYHDRRVNPRVTTK